MAGKINLVTGETYTLAELFSDERRIIIPDLQRDYCWGDDNNVKSSGDKGELVTGFVTNILDLFPKCSPARADSLNMGLLYGYEIPADHIQLCDGQQRLTTLYLLLGMINKRCGCFRRYLISDFEYKRDGKDPYLNYAIRESSLYFLSDLVCKFFIGASSRVADVRSEDWYFSDYDFDPSIQSMLNALAKIEKILDEKIGKVLDEETVERIRGFGDWLLNKITFLYFDMGNRKNGEETFVVINTTGEPLSSAQNLKPLVIGECKNEKDVPKRWEEIETWFWRKAQELKIQKLTINDTADAGFAEFLRWVTIIELFDQPAPEGKQTGDIKYLIQLILQGEEYEFPYKKISFDKIYKYWKSLCWLEGKPEFSIEKTYFSPGVNHEVKKHKAIGQIDCFVLLPVLKFVFLNIATIESDTFVQRNARRIHEYFKNLGRTGNVKKAVNSLVGEAIRVVDLIEDGDIISLIGKKDVSRQLLSDEELLKLTILKESANRNQTEEAFWDAQKHQIWSGEIRPVVEWAIDGAGNFDLQSFRDYQKKFEEVFSCGYGEDIDDARRAFLTLSLEAYPIVKGRNLSFGYDEEDWQRIISRNKEPFKRFFDSFAAGESKQWIQKSIVEYSGSNEWTEFIKRPELMRYCQKKNVQRWGGSLILINSIRATTYREIKSFCLYLDYKNHPEEYGDWCLNYSSEGNAPLIFSKTENGCAVAVYIYHARSEENDYVVSLSVQGVDDDGGSPLTQAVKERLTKPATQILGHSTSTQDGRFEVRKLSLNEVKQKVHELLFFHC